MCGHERRPPVSKVATVDGDLVELDRDSKLQKHRQRERTIELRGRSIPLEQFFGELKAYGALHAYKPGWAANKYREAIGVWPNAYKWAPEIPASAEVISWIRSRQIAFAKRRG